MTCPSIRPARILVLSAMLLAHGCAAPMGGPWQAASGRRWDVVRLAGEKPIEGSTLFLTFAADGRIAGHAGVNRFFGTYQRSKPHGLQMGALGATKMYANQPSGVMEQEKGFLELLGRVSAYRLTDGRLELFASPEEPPVVELQRRAQAHG